MSSKRKIFLYKYQSCGHEYYEENLKAFFSQQVFLSSVDELNDPFEGTFILKNILPKDLKKNKEMWQFYVQSAQKEKPNLTEVEFSERIKQLPLDSICRNLIKNLFNKHGVLCLTSDSSSIPMWAHYGDNHKGYCVKFELDFDYIIRSTVENNATLQEMNNTEYFKNILTGKEIVSFTSNITPEIEGIFTKINYYDKPPVLDMYKFTKIKVNTYEQREYLVKNSIGGKFRQWEYENEFRLILNNNSYVGGFCSLRNYAPFLKITGIILGYKMERKNIEKLQNIYRNSNSNGVRLFQAKCSNEEYKICHVPLKKRSKF